MSNNNYANLFTSSAIVGLLATDFRRSTPGFRRVATELGYTLRQGNDAPRGALRPGQFLVFLNAKRTQIAAMNHAGMLVRGIDLGRQLTRADITGFLSSFGIELTTPTRKSQRVVNAVTATPIQVAQPVAAVPAPATRVKRTTAKDIVDLVREDGATKRIINLPPRATNGRFITPGADIQA